MKSKVVTLCGSTRFSKEFQFYNLIETLKGNIVLSIGCNLRDDEVFKDLTREQLEAIEEKLDKLHKRKIDMSDEVLVLNINGYIGESTKSEIEYAIKNNKKVRFVESSKLQKSRPIMECYDELL